MRQFSYPVKETAFISGMVKDYLNKDPFLAPFYGEFPDMNGILKHLDSRKGFPVNRELLVKVLMQQYEGVESVPPQVLKNISDLKDEQTFTVTTGHQLNILTGPVFSVYKILTTIKLAEQISRSIKGSVVPVFWMASEDHDIDEIDHLFYKGEQFSCEFDSKGAAGRLNSDPVADMIDQLQEEKKELIYNDLLKFFREAYSGSNTLAGATRLIMNRLFGHHGLVVIDADDKELKAAFASDMEKEIADQPTFKSVSSANDLLRERYKLLVNPRDVNLFFLENEGRYRIKPEGEGRFILVDDNRNFSRSELIQSLRTDPQQFSPNVILRTVYQEKILPNVCYIGGPGEISYWLQFKGVFDQLEIPFPCIVLRNSFLLIDAKTEKKMKALGLDGPEIFLSKEKVTEELLERTGELFDEKEYQKRLEDIFNELNHAAIKLDQSLQYPVEGELKKVKRSVEKLKNKFKRALKKREQVAMNRLTYVHDHLFPDGSLQERKANILNFMDSADSDLMSYLYENTDPLDHDIKVVFYG